MPGTNARHMRNVEIRLVSSTLRNSSSVKSTRFLRTLIPALLIKICALPNLAFTASATAPTWSSLVTSATKMSAVAPLAAISSRTCSSRARSRATSAICAPAPASAFAIASPRPRLPPVITAVRPFRSICIPRLFLSRSAKTILSKRNRFRTERRCFVQQSLPPRRFGIEIDPARRRNHRCAGHCLDQQIPAFDSATHSIEYHPPHNRRNKCSQISKHIHGCPNRCRIRAAHLHARVPRDRDHKIARKASEAHHQHRWHHRLNSRDGEQQHCVREHPSHSHGPPRQPARPQSRCQRSKAAEKQWQYRQRGCALRGLAAPLAQIGRQPRDVEVPYI